MSLIHIRVFRVNLILNRQLLQRIFLLLRSQLSVLVIITPEVNLKDYSVLSFFFLELPFSLILWETSKKCSKSSSS